MGSFMHPLTSGILVRHSCHSRQFYHSRHDSTHISVLFLYNRLYNLYNEQLKNPIFKKVSIGAGKYPGKKDTLIVDFEECPIAEIIADGNIELAADAVTVKNEFLLKATGKDSKARRKAMKREDKKGN